MIAFLSFELPLQEMQVKLIDKILMNVCGKNVILVLPFIGITYTDINNKKLKLKIG